MMEPLEPRKGEALEHLVSGIEAGIIGGAAMLGFLVSAALWGGHDWWEIPNLLGSTFYGIRALRSGLGIATVSGTALHFAITGALGGVFGLVCGRIQQRGWLILLGILAGAVWYNAANTLFWARVNPRVPVYLPQPSGMLSHLLFGACLGWIGQAPKAVEKSAETFPS